MNKYLIIGLPRSRTQWLSNFMTYNGSMCYHEQLGKVNTYEEYVQSFEDKDYKFIGDSDTAGLAIVNNPEFKDVPKVIIHRDIEEILPELYEMFGYSEDATRGLYSQQYLLNKLDGLHIEFNDIDDKLEDIWNYCVDLPFDYKRANQLKNMKIQINSLDFMSNMPLMTKVYETGELKCR